MKPALLLALTAAIAWSSAEASQRSYAAKAEFKRSHPCPANNQRRGPCPGYEVDHAIPLKCKGDDLPHNMQWLTIEEHKRKTKREARWCRP
jgi:hypothetical protein